MNSTAHLAGALKSALHHPSRSVVEIVDELLRMCWEGNLTLECTAEQCTVRSCEGVQPQVVDFSWPKSVFRAVIARVAALCNERIPNSVSPYGGVGELSVPANPSATIQARFANSGEEQSLQLIALPLCMASARCRWKDLQDILAQLERIYDDELTTQIDSLWKQHPHFIRIMLQMASRAVHDHRLWDIICQLVKISPNSNRSILATFGDLDTMHTILGEAHHCGDVLTCQHLKSYAAQIVAIAERATRRSSPNDGGSEPQDGIW